MSWNDPARRARRDIEKRLSEVPGDPTLPQGLLQALKDDIPADLAPPRSRPASPPWWQTHGLRAAAAVVLVVGAGLAALFLWPGVEGPAEWATPSSAPVATEPPREQVEVEQVEVEQVEVEQAEGEPAAEVLERQAAGESRGAEDDAAVEEADHGVYNEVALLDAAEELMSPAPAPPPPPAPAPVQRRLEPRATVEDEIDVRGEAAAPSVTSATTGAEAREIHAGAGFVREITDRPFVITQGDRFSAFGLGVDRGSYELTRELVRAGRLPDPDLVRLEEWLDVLAMDDPAPPPGAAEAFAFTFAGSPSPFGGSWAPLGDSAGHRYFLRLGLRAREAAPGSRRVVAEDAYARIEWNPAAVVGYRLLGYEFAPRQRGLERPEGTDVRDGEALSVLYEVILAPTVPAGRVLGTWTVAYRDPLTDERREENHLLKSDGLSHGWDSTPATLRFVAEVAEATYLLGKRPVAARQLQAVGRRMRELVEEEFAGDATRAEMTEVVTRAAEVAAAGH
jgi:hypothetical protein